MEKLFPPASRETFARRVLRKIKKLNPTSSPIFDPEEFSISKGASGGVIFLENAYAEYCASPVFKRAEVIDFYARLNTAATDTLPDDFAKAKPHLLPRVRERFYLASMKLALPLRNAKAPEVASRLLNDDLTVEVVYDTPQAMASISESQFAKWGTTFDAALQIARDNLWKISNEDFIQVQPGLFVGTWQDFHAASRLFLHDLLWQIPVNGAHVAMIPNRQTLFVTGDQDTASLIKMAEFVTAAAAEPRFMTGSAFRLQGSTWQHFLPDPNSPAYVPLRTLHIQSLGQMYAEQKQLLERTFEKQQILDAPFVASFSGMTSPDGRLTTFAVWTEGIDSLIPETDLLAFVADVDGKPESLGMADGPAARQKLADLLRLTDDYPPRWRTLSFPSRDRLDSLPLRSP